MQVQIPNVRLPAPGSGGDSLGLRSRVIDQARDYLYQERVTHRLRRGDEAIAARVRGYQDHYTPAAEETSVGLRVTCTCDRAWLCAHAGALLLAFAAEPATFMPAERVGVASGRIGWWPWMAAAPFPWDDVPEHPGVLMLPRTADARWEAEVPWRAAPPARAHGAMLRTLGLVHPSWWAYEPLAESFRAAWTDPALIRLARGQLGAWIDVLFRAPELDLRPLWQKAAGLPLVAEWPHIRRLVWLADTGARDPADILRITRLLELAELAADGLDAEEEVGYMHRALAWADPTGVDYALYLDRQGRRREAIAWLEEHLPQDKAARAPYRRLLIAWSDGAERVAHQVADFIEAPDPGKRRRLFHGLDPEQAARLAKALPELTADDESDPPRR